MKLNKITETLEYSNQDEYQRFSVSKIKTYKECSEMFKLKYVDKLDVYHQSTATLTGTLMHSTLEYLYGTKDDEVETAVDAFFKVLPTEFAKLGIVSVESILGELLDYHQDIANLYKRASKNYKGADAIRTGKGETPKVPEMTGVWKAECKRLRLEERKNLIDYTMQASKNGLESVSITEVFSRAFNLASKYNTPNALHEILYLELPLSNWDRNTNTLLNPTPFPNCPHKDIYLNGYIDNISVVNVKGKLYNAVIDYKTSKEIFNESIVEHNQQLLMYAKGAEYLLGIPIDYIGILSLIKNDLVLVPVDKELQNEVIKGFNQVIDKTLSNEFTKHYPDSKYSMCLNSFGGACPFLKNCWPKSFDYLNKNNFSDDFLNEIGY